MTITRGEGNLLTQDVDALVNTVNTEGIMGKGIALQFKKAWPAMFKDYSAACKRGEVVPGKMHVWETGSMTGPRFVVNFPTKRHWRARSQLADIAAGLTDLVAVIRDREITSIAIPPLGCGNGGLEWSQVEPLIRSALAPVATSTEVRLFAPGSTPDASDQPNREVAPRLTPARAALLALMRAYRDRAQELPTQIVVQKLAYFLQNAGQPLSLAFTEKRYGPYDDNLRKVLRSLEGHYISGFGDGSAPVTEAPPLELLPSADAELADVERQDPATKDRINAVLADVEGFESPYGLELLATVHWAMAHDQEALADADRAYQRVHDWSPRKAQLFTRQHVVVAWQAVRDRDLLATKG